jgi:hypothetical protein
MAEEKKHEERTNSYSPRAERKTLTEGYQPRGDGKTPASVPPLVSGVYFPRNSPLPMSVNEPQAPLPPPNQTKK